MRIKISDKYFIQIVYWQLVHFKILLKQITFSSQIVHINLSHIYLCIECHIICSTMFTTPSILFLLSSLTFFIYV
jgi:hypothetical protein